jgi:ATP phosphoribosyltransferase
VRVVLVRASDVPTYVQYGGADLGVAGKDVLIEHGGEGLYQPLDLQIARCRMSVAVRADFDYAGAVKQGSRIRVATKYTQIARQHFADKGVHVDLIKLYGSMELAPLTGLADAIVDLVSTGSTLKANHLVEVERIMRHLVAPGGQPGCAEAQARADARADRSLEAALRADHLPCAGVSRPDPPPRHRQRRLRGRVPARAALVGRDRRRDRAARGRILADVRARGDAAVLEYTQRFDGLCAVRQRWPRWSSARRLRRLRRRSRRPSAARCRPRPAGARYHERQLEACGAAGATATPTARCWARRSRRWTAWASTCPAARRPIRPAVLMNAIPAHVAGVGEIIMVVPTPAGDRATAGAGGRPRGRRDRAFTIGGAQAVAALAYGTATVPRVDKITGPGNAYVASAKRRVFGQVGIDMIAGPSEILVLADGSTPPTGWRWTCSARPSTTSWRRASCCARTPAYIDAGAGRDRPPAARHAAPRRDPRQRWKAAAR